MQEKETRTVGVILAAGKGERMGGEIPKQFLLLEDKPLFLYSVLTFTASTLIDELCLVIPSGREQEIRAWVERFVKEKPVRYVLGGATRTLSSYNAYRSYRELGVRVNLIIHDAARPLLSLQDLNAVTAALAISPAAVLATPSPDTVYQVNEGHTIVDIPPRSSLWCAQTPQAFRAEVLEKMYACEPKDAQLTDDVGLMRAVSPDLPIRLVEATKPNPKLTTAKDLPWLKYLLEEHKEPTKGE